MSKVRDVTSLKKYFLILLIIGAMINFSQLMTYGYLSEQSGTISKRPAFSVAQMDLPSNLDIAIDQINKHWESHIPLGK